MKILVDINHPAHVHYIKNLIKIMTEMGHNFLIISRNKECEHELLKSMNYPFISRGKGANKFIFRVIYCFSAISIIFKAAKDFKPNLLISFGTPYSAIVSLLLRRIHISIIDTEHHYLYYMLTNILSEIIITTECFHTDFGKKQIRFNGFMELCYLHPNYYSPDSSIIELLKVQKDEKYVIMRFVSWHAFHDSGQSGLSPQINCQ